MTQRRSDMEYRAKLRAMIHFMLSIDVAASMYPSGVVERSYESKRDRKAARHTQFALTGDMHG